MNVVPITTQVNNNYPRMTELARTFPCLEDAPVEPFDPEVLDAWAAGPGPSHGGLHAARFIIAVFHGRAGRPGKRRKTPEKDRWNGTHRFPVDTYSRCGIFDSVDALGTWDHAHRAAFVAWASDPWWP